MLVFLLNESMKYVRRTQTVVYHTYEYHVINDSITFPNYKQFYYNIIISLISLIKNKLLKKIVKKKDIYIFNYYEVISR